MQLVNYNFSQRIYISTIWYTLPFSETCGVFHMRSLSLITPTVISYHMIVTLATMPLHHNPYIQWKLTLCTLLMSARLTIG